MDKKNFSDYTFVCSSSSSRLQQGVDEVFKGYFSNPETEVWRQFLFLTLQMQTSNR